jgi:hypothetical protein
VCQLKGPQSVAGKIYTVRGNPSTGEGAASSRATCNEGDDGLSGGHHASNLNTQSAIRHVNSYKFTNSIWEADVLGIQRTDPVFVQAEAFCFDNPTPFCIFESQF